MTTTVTTTTSGSDSGTRAGSGPRRFHAPATTNRRSKLARVLMALVVVVAVVGVLAWWVPTWTSGGPAVSPDRFTVMPRSFNVVLREKGELKAAKSTDIKSEVEGRATVISLVEEGKAVKKGDLLVELASDQIDDRIQEEELKETNAITAFESAKTELDIQRDKNASDIRKALLEIDLKGLELEKYTKGEWEEALKDADIAIEQAENQLENSKEDYEAAKQLLERNFITRTEYKQDEFNFKKAQWDLVKAQMGKKVLKTYTHVADLRKRQSDLEEAQKECERVKKNAEAEENKKVRNLEGKTKELELIQNQLAELRAQKEKCRIFAPTQGFVVYYAESWRWGSGDQIKEGAEVHERQVIMQLPDTSEMVVSVRIHESKTSKLAMGLPAIVEVEGIPDRRFSGKVTKIAVVADTQNRWLNPDLKEYETEITLDETDAPLKPGATAHVELLVGSVEDALAVPVQAVYSKGGQKYVFQDTRDGVNFREVQIGAASTEWAEVLSGIKKGDEVLLAFTDDNTRDIPEPDNPVESFGAQGGKVKLNANSGQKMKMRPGRAGGGSRGGRKG